ncbi:erythropoietin isoform X2 [Clupea harengus]|uniref:Erythropoietin n=1 Tax=Clupea harengus TaxID=7950 RepID=A0A6P8H042_CLUHA|nr:erythropoietin isoform X2 [Clupea harengus]
MEIPRLFTVLLMVLEWTSPGLPSPLWPICDLSALDHFIKKAQEAEAAMRSCKEECLLSVPLTVPQPSVDYNAWRKKDSQQQAQEVQSGLWLLSQALQSLKASISNAALHSHIDNSLGNIISIGQVLRSLSIPEYTPTGAGSASQDTWRVSSASTLFQVHFNFLRGKVRLLISHAAVCQQAFS